MTTAGRSCNGDHSWKIMVPVISHHIAGFTCVATHIPISIISALIEASGDLSPGNRHPITEASWAVVEEEG